MAEMNELLEQAIQECEGLAAEADSFGSALGALDGQVSGDERRILSEARETLGALQRELAELRRQDEKADAADEELRRRLTESDEILGTPEYMAPEQSMVGTATTATDVYALGLIAYEMLAKRGPFDVEATPIATILKRNREAARPLRTFLPHVDPKWDAALARCLQRDPAARFQHPADFISAVTGGGGSPRKGR